MTLMAASRMAVSRRSVVGIQQQRRGFIDYLVNYPDHVRFFFVLQWNVESLCRYHDSCTFSFLLLTSCSFCMYLRSFKRRQFNAREELDWEKRIRLG